MTNRDRTDYLLDRAENFWTKDELLFVMEENDPNGSFREDESDGREYDHAEIALTWRDIVLTDGGENGMYDFVKKLEEEGAL